jgi:carbon storage regulator
MLLLSRKEGEELVIGNNSSLTVVAIRGNQVRLGVTAPPDVPIQRAELRLKAEDHRILAERPRTSEAKR